MNVLRARIGKRTRRRRLGDGVDRLEGRCLMATDLAPPAVTAQAIDPVIWPPNGRLAPVTVVGTVADDPSGAIGHITGMTVQVVDEYTGAGPVVPVNVSQITPIAGTTDYSYAITLPLEARRLGQDRDGRQYTIIVRATDDAGNTGEATAAAVVPHDRGHAAILPGSTPVRTFPGVGSAVNLNPISGRSRLAELRLEQRQMQQEANAARLAAQQARQAAIAQRFAALRLNHPGNGLALGHLKQSLATTGLGVGLGNIGNHGNGNGHGNGHGNGRS